MQAIRAATIEGFNEFLQGQRAAPGRADLRLVQFDHEYELVYDAPLAEALELTGKTYEPRGTTALLDAIGPINEVGHKLSQIEAKRPARIVFVVVTDGLENASHEFSREQIFDMISHQRSLYKREFIFLGANQDAIAEGKKHGISEDGALYFRATPAGMRSSMRSAGGVARMARMGRAVKFDAQQRWDAMRPKAPSKS